jgi:ABC-2 type transport system permease protein
MTIFVYGVQVMKGVMEEKMSRIVEVIISSVKPFELMMGKIMGVALVGLTQFLLWIGLTFLITTASSQFLGTNRFQAQSEQVQAQIAKSDPKSAAKMKQKTDSTIGQVTKALSTLNIPLILGTFLFYFFGGYLLYSALFAAVGSAVDNETDTQQFMMPITIPIILSIIMAQFVLREPDGSLAFWMSMIPFTSPIIMMVRMPFGVPAWEIALSMALLVMGFIFTTWLAARIYRIGILMYGKKVSYKELSKWLFYKG